jgi:hypothetical protein
MISGIINCLQVINKKGLMPKSKDNNNAAARANERD